VTDEEREAFRKNHKGKLPPRLHAHADMDVLTILYQRPGGYWRCWVPGSTASSAHICKQQSLASQVAAIESTSSRYSKFPYPRPIMAGVVMLFTRIAMNFHPDAYPVVSCC